MTTLAPGDDTPVLRAHDDPAFEIGMMAAGRMATLKISWPALDGAGDDELERRALDALLSAGIDHGLDRGLVAHVIAARDEVAHVVARATAPVAPVDGVLELPFLEKTERDPLHSVEAGTLLARCTPARDGSDGIMVTGQPLHAPPPQRPEVSAGEGAVASVVGDGITVVRSLIDGRPRFEGGRVFVDPVLRPGRIAPTPGLIHVFGSVEVDHLPEGTHLAVTGDVRVIGDLERVHIESGGDVEVTGACVGCHIHAGSTAKAHRALIEALGDADEQMTSAAAMAGQLVATAVAAGRRLHDHDALHAVATTRFPEMGASIARAARILRDPDLRVAERVSDAIAEAAAVAASVDNGEQVPLERASGVAGSLAKAMATMRGTAGHTSGVRADHLQACTVEACGDLLLTGPGTYNTDAVVGGDLHAHGPGATVRGGTLEISGRLQCAELGAPGGARVRVLLPGAGGGTRLSAGIAHPGVEVVCGGRSIAIGDTTLNLAVGFDDENRVVSSGGSPG